MDKDSSEGFGAQLVELFKEAALDEFFGCYLFDVRDQSRYIFTPDEKGDSLCLVEKRESNGEQHYEIRRIPEDLKFKSNRIVPNPCTFGHCEEIPETWLMDGSSEDIKSKIKQGGKSLGEMLNKAFVSILLEAVSTKTQLPNQSLDQSMANVLSDVVKAGFRADVFLFPEYLEAKLIQRGIIILGFEVKNDHYVGKTKFDQAAYRVSDLPDDTVLFIDSSIGVTIRGKSNFYTHKMGSFTYGICGYFNLNPIVKNTAGIIALEGIDKALDYEAGGVRSMSLIPYVNLNRIEELKAISSPDFDLRKLVRLCEEINLSFTNECYYATAMLVRALVDHVPSIFGQPNFAQVANNYSGAKSRKESLLHLETLLRSIADTHLHAHIRRSESMPNETQVDFHHNLDVLLGEIVVRLS